MTAARRLAAILATDVAGYSRLIGEDEAGTARAVREHREAAHAITLNANYGFPPTTTSTVMIFNDRFTSIPAVIGNQASLRPLSHLIIALGKETPD